MTNTLLLWFQNLCLGISEAGSWLVSQPFKDVNGIPENIQQLTPLALIGISGLIIFIGVAVVKWVIS